MARAANPALVSFYVLGGGVPSMGLLALTIWRRWDFDAFFGATGWVFASGCFCVALGVLLNYGQVYAVAIVRIVGFALSSAALAIALCAGAMLAAGGLESAGRSADVVVLLFSAIMVAMTVLLIRGLLRVRWLDPASELSEWEKQPLPD